MRHPGSGPLNDLKSPAPELSGSDARFKPEMRASRGTIGVTLRTEGGGRPGAHPEDELEKMCRA